jgi:lipopolysaccharide heptosyltransferase III
MTNPRDADALLSRLPAGARIAIIRLRSLGDCVLTTPAIAVLKAHRSDLKIDVIVESRFAGVFEGNPNIARVLPGMARQPASPDLVLNLHGGTRSMWMTLASGAKSRAGFGHHRFGFIYTHKIPRAQEIIGVERPVHTAEHVASAMFWLGVPQCEIPRARLYITGSSESEPVHREPAYAVIHAFASAPEKTWPAGLFAALARHLRTAGLEPVFVAGPTDDAAPFDEFQVIQAAPLSDLKRLMAGATLFIGNDSGPAHIAAAFGVPVVALFGASNPATWAPWRTESEVLVSKGHIADIALEQVIRAAESLRVKA